MKLEYKRELDHNYLILEEQQETVCEGYEVYMLEENQIPGLLKCTLQRLNQRQRFCYEVTSRQPLDIILERKRLIYGDLQNLLKGIHRALLGAREYLLDVNRLMLLPEYIYLNLDTGLPELCYFPYYEKPIKEQFFELAEYLLGKLDRQDRAGVELGYEIYKMASEENCSIEEIINFRRQEECPAPADKVRLFWEETEKSPAAMQKIAEPEQVYGTKGVEMQEKDKKRRGLWGKRKRGCQERIFALKRKGCQSVMKGWRRLRREKRKGHSLREKQGFSQTGRERDWSCIVRIRR